MKSSILLLSATFLLIISFGCKTEIKKEVNPASTENTEIKYDSILAQKVGADNYGMKHYVMAFLKAGPNRTQDSITAAEIQKAHMANIKRMADEGKLVTAGPFEDDGELRGIYIFNVATLEEAKALTESDPAVKEGRLVME
jgi:uncharacterized protein YciI